jgi:hypothetical protein
LMDVVNNKQVETLPTLTRNPYDLVSIGGNIVPDDSARGSGYALNGQRSASTNMLLDGSDNNDTFTATVGQEVPLDSVQEFSVVTSSFTAEYGRAGGGVVNVATKSGSNNFHGSLYEFNRVSALAANSFQNNANEVDKPVFTRNQFGYSVGGPIVKDKLFFFNNTEWFRIRSSANYTVLVPTSQLIAASAPATKDFFTAFGTLKSGALMGHTYLKSEISGLCSAGGLCAALADSTPVWQTVNYTLPADSGGGDPRNEYQTVARVDWAVTPNTTIYGRFALQSQDYFAGTIGRSPYQGFDTGETDFNQNYLLSITHTFSPRLVSQSKVVYNRLNQLQPYGDQPPAGTLYLSSNAVASSIKGIEVNLPGYLPYSPGNAIPFGGPQNLGQIFEDVSWTRSNHTFRFGGSYIYIRDNRAFGAYAYAVEQLGSNLNQGMENFLKGELRTFQAAVYPQGKYPGDTVTLPVGPPDFTRSNRYHDFALYGQDTWRLRPGLTVNLGLRWEYYGVQHNKDPQKDSNFYLGRGASLEERVMTGKVMLAPDGPYGALWASDHNNLGPRLGIAWDVFGNGKTSLRGGYGISYERNFGNVTYNVIQNPPNYAVVQIGAADVGGYLPIYTDPAGPLGGSTGSKVLPRSSLRAVDENIKNAFAHNYSAALEQEIAPNTIFSLEYSGSRGVGLYGINRENMPGSLNVYNKTEGLDYINNQYAVINYRTAGGFSRYNAMNVGLKARDLHKLGLQLEFNYTWAHSIDNLSSTFSEYANSFNLGFLDPRNPELDSGDADFDVRHRVAISAVWELPFARNQGGIAKQVLGGWSLAPIIHFRTGTPFSIYDCTNSYYMCNRMLIVDPAGTALKGSDNPAAIPDVPNSFAYIDISAQSAGTGDNAYYNPYTFTADFGPYPANMSRRNVFRGPGYYNFDLGIYKNFSMKERYTLQFRAEFYNMLNHANLYVDGTTADISGSDTIFAMRGINNYNVEDRRNIQLALKFIF